MTRCNCGSYAVNPSHHGRDGSDTDLCDVCYWRKRAERKPMTLHQMMHYLPQGNADAGTVSAIAAAVEKFHGIKETK